MVLLTATRPTSLKARPILNCRRLFSAERTSPRLLKKLVTPLLTGAG